jgi:tetratricopeptide (TPR) repeat protein
VAGRLGDPERHVVALRNSGLAALRVGRVGEAFDRLEQAVAEARGPAVADGVLRDSLDSLGFARWEVGDAATAVSLLEEALAIDDAPDRSLRIALHRYHHGLALIDIGKLEDAERALAAALRTSQEVRDDLGTAYVEQAMADVDIRQGRWSDAAARLDRALATHQKLGRPDGLAETLRALADLAAAEGRWAEALIPLRRALDLWRRLGSQPQIARVLARLDRISAAAGDEAAAATYREERRSVLAALNLDEASMRVPPFLIDP